MGVVRFSMKQVLIQLGCKLLPNIAPRSAYQDAGFVRLVNLGPTASLSEHNLNASSEKQLEFFDKSAYFTNLLY